jgi:hypothetical protein
MGVELRRAELLLLRSRRATLENNPARIGLQPLSNPLAGRSVSVSATHRGVVEIAKFGGSPSRGLRGE